MLRTHNLFHHFVSRNYGRPRFFLPFFFNNQNNSNRQRTVFSTVFRSTLASEFFMEWIKMLIRKLIKD